MINNVASGTKLRKNTESLHGILPTHVYINFKIDQNWDFWIFIYTKKEQG